MKEFFVVGVKGRGTPTHGRVGHPGDHNNCQGLHDALEEELRHEPQEKFLSGRTEEELDYGKKEYGNVESGEDENHVLIRQEA
ncbi:unnamed protein product [Allacma fusca]|uniref:Uncharacterized protein n=1 Tax=Allacma fusca TaxID=39272 RepID=A0A8J2PBY5_9HEXA|nr:unnamed protein product [Allacma fusca]